MSKASRPEAFPFAGYETQRTCILFLFLFFFRVVKSKTCETRNASKRGEVRPPHRHAAIQRTRFLFFLAFMRERVFSFKFKLRPFIFFPVFSRVGQAEIKGQKEKKKERMTSSCGANDGTSVFIICARAQFYSRLK